MYENKNFYVVVKNHITKFESNSGEISIAGVLEKKDAIIGLMMCGSKNCKLYNYIKVQNLEELATVVGFEGTSRITAGFHFDESSDIIYDTYVGFLDDDSYDVYTVLPVQDLDTFGISRVNVVLGLFDEDDDYEAAAEAEADGQCFTGFLQMDAFDEEVA